jgi:hypothetical protein
MTFKILFENWEFKKLFWSLDIIEKLQQSIHAYTNAALSRVNGALTSARQEWKRLRKPHFKVDKGRTNGSRIVPVELPPGHIRQIMPKRWDLTQAFSLAIWPISKTRSKKTH